MERTRSVQELFDQPRLFFIGAPGAGKSALTRWLLLKLCVPGERVEGLPDDLVPVRVELRTFEQEHRRAGAGYTVFDHVARVEADLHGPLTGDRLRALAEQGRVMWLFDGLDEVAEPSRRREMAARITGLLDLYKKCRAVVTSRAAGAEVARPILEGAGFQTYALQDFTTEQRDRFLGAWHDLVFRRDPATGAQRRNRMTAAIEAASSLQELCKSPLLCSMLAYLHREESLPRRRHLLYQKVLERMAEHWDANKGLPPRPAAEQFELEDKLAFLRALAWQMQSDPRTAGNAIGRSELEDFTAGFCERRWGQPRDAARRRAEVLIQQLYARNGVLSFLGADTYGFAHRAFLEHLAAAEAAERFRGRQWEIEDLGKVFVAHWREAGWEETLLLLCGQLQEDGEAGCARVVRLLQMIGEGRAAEIYGELNDYLVFCIKALGELSQLERGVPGDFARAINEALIVEMIDHGSVGFGKLNPAFRRCGGRWPEVRALAATILESDQRKKAPPFRLGSYGVWIAAGGKALRAELLSGALGRREIPPYLLCQEAAHFGAWSDQEVSTILDACQDRGERDQFHVAAAMALTAAAEWCENDRPINLLLNLAKQAVAEDLRIQSAGILLKVRLHVDVAKEILIEASKTGSPIARHATLCLLEGFADLVVQSLAAFAEAYGYALAELVKLARDLESAKEYLPKVLAAIRAAGDSEVLLGAALATLQCGLPCFEESEILERWRRIKDRERRCASIEPFRFIKGGERLAVKGWMDLLDGGLEVASEIARQCVDLRPETAGPMLLVLWRRLLDLDRNVAFLPLVRHILEIAPDRELEGRARQIRDDLLQGSMPEDTRMHAARSFQRIYPPAHAVLEELSDTAQHEWIRWTAARLTGNLASLNDLARRTKSDQLRGNIRHTLDLYGEINSLLQVGKLRRARVRFDGRDAGILEELTKVGNGTRFLYNAAYDGPPIAPNMPLGQEYKDTEALLPFFANLLPEGALYEQTARRLGLKRNDRLGVLLRVGGDTMGAIEILPMEPA